MSRAGIITLSVVCCVFGGLALAGPQGLRGLTYLLNVVLAIGLFVVAGKDLTARGWRLGYLFAGAYLLPLIGPIVYVGLSNDRPKVNAGAPST